MDGYKGPLTGKTVKDVSNLANVIIMPGEFVVAKPYAKKVEAYLKKHGITLPLPH